MIKKTIMITIMILGVSLINISTATAAATISIGNGTAVIGGTVAVPLMINGVTDAGSVEVNLTYTPSVVIPISITHSDFDLPPQDPPINPQSGHIRINAMQFAAGLDGNVKIGDITLQAVGDEGESCPLYITEVIVQDMAMQNIPVDDTVNGIFKINTPPSLYPIGSWSVDEGQTLHFIVSASDPDGDELTFSATDMPAGASFNPDIGVFSWTPTYDQAGVYRDIHFEVTDGTLTDWENIRIKVNNAKIGISGLVRYDRAPFISDPEADPLILTIDNDTISVSSYLFTFCSFQYPHMRPFQFGIIPWSTARLFLCRL